MGKVDCLQITTKCKLRAYFLEYTLPSNQMQTACLVIRIYRYHQLSLTCLDDQEHCPELPDLPRSWGHVSAHLTDWRLHDDVIKWKYFLRYWPFVWGIHRSPVNSPHKGQWREALMVSLTSVWTNGWANNRDAGDLRHHRAHYDVSVMRQNGRHFVDISWNNLVVF